MPTHGIHGYERRHDLPGDNNLDWSLAAVVERVILNVLPRARLRVVASLQDEGEVSGDSVVKSRKVGARLRPSPLRPGT